jgi:hypothetical protein
MNLPSAGNSHMIGCWVGRAQIPAINAKPHADMIEKQQVIASWVPITREA